MTPSTFRSIFTTLRPGLIVLLAMSVAFIVFIMLDSLEQMLFAQLSMTHMRFFHFFRGFLATAGGMSLVWLYMSRKEKEIYKLRDKLADQLQTRTQQVTEAEATISEQREDFINALKHNLHTPILAHRRAVDLMLDKEFGKLTQAQLEVLTAMQENSERLCVLVDRLVEIYRYQNGIKDINLRKIAIGHIVKKIELVNSADIACGKLEVLVQTSRDQEAICDIDQLLVMLNILISNGLRHARAKCSLSVSKEANDVIFKIEDDGGSMEPENVPKLFTRFYAEYSAGKRNPVVGTGLCLCFQIASAHRGTITCGATPGIHTEFTVRIPH